MTLNTISKIRGNNLFSVNSRWHHLIWLIVDATTSNGTCMSYEEEDTCLSLIVDGTTSNGTDAPKEKRIIRNDMNK